LYLFIALFILKGIVIGDRSGRISFVRQGLWF
jgi:hypothetical protein